MNRLFKYILCKNENVSPINAILFSIIEFPTVLFLIVLQYADGINIGFPIVFFILSYFYLCLIIKSIPNLKLKNWLQFFIYLIIIPTIFLFHVLIWIDIFSGQPMCDFCP